MIGLVEAVDAKGDLVLVQADIARNDKPVGDLHDQRGIVEPTIGIDQKARELRDDSRRPKQGGQAFGDPGDAEVVGDVAVKILRPQPETAVSLRDRILGVIADEEETGGGIARDAPVGPRPEIGSRQVVQTSLQGAVPLWS